MAFVDRHLIKRLSLATEDLVEAGPIVGKPEVEPVTRRLRKVALSLQIADE